MSKEHAGGFLPAGFMRLPLEWVDDDPTPVAVQDFDWDSLDSIQDAAREALENGQFEKFIDRLRKRERRTSQLELVMQLVGFADRFSSRAMGVDLLVDVCGLSALEGRTQSDYARSWGISKQAWQEDAERMRKLLGLPLTRTMRGAPERQKMRLRNYRRT